MSGCWVCDESRWCHICRKLEGINLLVGGLLVLVLCGCCVCVGMLLVLCVYC